MTYYVDASAYFGGNGTKERPFKQINEAAKIAKPGDEVIVLPGVYHENVNPVNAGTEEARITYKSSEPLGAVITGAEKTGKWEPYKGTVWKYTVNNSVFGDYNPYTTVIGGDWYFAQNTLHTGAVYCNDEMLYEADSLDDCIKGEVYPYSWDQAKSIYKWYSEQDGDTTVIYANFQDKDPNKEKVEINVRRECFFPQKTGISYITVSGFKIEKAATTWAPPAAFQDGMIGPHWSKGWIIENCEICNSRCAGISLGKYYDPENDHYFTRKHVKSPTQMERDAVCRGQYHGWLKENIGSHIVRGCHIHDCGQGGIIGRMGSVFSLIENNHIHHINIMHQLGGAEIAGIKLHAAIDVVMRRNHIHNCEMGIWCDWEAQGTRISQNLMHDNAAPKEAKTSAMNVNQDIFIEVGHGPTLIDNNILLSPVSLRLASEGVALVHNLILGKFTSVGGGSDMLVDNKVQPRYTPYHIRHRTEVAGFMTLLHGDDRFYNNVFIKQEGAMEEGQEFGMLSGSEGMGTSMFDEYPTYDEWIANFDIGKKADMMKLATYHFSHLPVYAGGNAYLGGAKAYRGEKNINCIIDSRAEVKLTENNGSYELECPGLKDILKDTDSIITSDVLGYAFEPEERFENPDGTEIVFDRDYFGNDRGLSTIPGPFAEIPDGKFRVF